MSDPYAHKHCKMPGVKSEAKHYKYKKPGNPFRISEPAPQYEMVLYSDQSAVYAFKAFNKLLPIYRALPGQCQEPEPQRTMRPENPSMDGSKRKSSWIFMLPEKTPLSRKWRHTSRFLVLRSLHIH